MHLTATHIHPAAVKDILTGIFLCLLIIIIMHIMPMVGVFAWMILPLPVIFYRLKAGRPGSLAIMAVCLGLLTVFTGNIAFNLLYFGFFLITGFVMGECIEQLLSIEKMMLYTCMVVFGIFSIIVVGYTISRNQEIGSIVSDYLAGYKAFSAQFFSETAQHYPQMDVDIKRLEQINSLFMMIFPAIFINAYLTMMWLNILYIKKLLARKGLIVKPLENLTCWKAPDYLIVGVILSGVFMFLPVEILKAVGANSLLVLMFLYFLQGIAVISFFFNKKRAPFVLRFFLYILIAIQPLFMTLVVGCGLFDTWFNFRKLNMTT